MIEKEKFKGDVKVGESLLYPLEEKLKNFIIPKIPSFIHGYHLTLSTILWSILIMIFSYLADKDIRWLWMSSLTIFIQYITDSIDGGLNKYRRLGLIRWGYYMDHFLDYVFLCSLFMGYMFIVSDHFKYLLFFILVIFIGFMINSYLSFSITNKFRIAYYRLGPTEIRIVFIIINTLLIIFGKTYLSWSLPIVIALSFISLCVVVYDTQKVMWDVDIKNRSKSS